MLVTLRVKRVNTYFNTLCVGQVWGSKLLTPVQQRHTKKLKRLKIVCENKVA